MPLYLIEAPRLDVLSLADAKLHVNEPDNSYFDAVIEAAIRAAVGKVDGQYGKLNRALIDQTWELKIDCFPGCGYIRIPLPPLLEVVSVKYVDRDGNEQTFSAGSYHVSGIGGQGFITLRAGVWWPVIALRWPQAITVQFRAGYVDTSNSPPTGAVPEPIISAIKMIVGHLFRNRETVVIGETAFEIPQAADWLLETYVVYA